MIAPTVFAVVREASAEAARTVGRGLHQAGLGAIEITMTTPDAPAVIEELVGLGAPVGAGTVLDAGACRRCTDAGARFVVSPVTDLDVLEAAHRAGATYVGGALTPTEVLSAMRAGVDAVKVFPIASVGGPGYLSMLLEPIPGMRAVASGGVTPADVGDYLRAGAQAVCLSEALVDRAAVATGDIEAVARHARAVMADITEGDRHGQHR